MEHVGSSVLGSGFGASQGFAGCSGRPRQLPAWTKRPSDRVLAASDPEI